MCPSGYGRSPCISHGQTRCGCRRNRDTGKSPAGRKVARIRTVLRNVHHRFGQRFSQIELGIGFWEDAFRQAAVIQMNVWEFKNLKRKTLPLSAGNHRMVYGQADERHYHHGPVRRPRHLRGWQRRTCLLSAPSSSGQDYGPTGAGDTFAAGLTFRLNGKKAFTFDDFHKAMIEAGIWASFACTTYGGSGCCPDRAALEAFLESLGGDARTPVRIIDKRSAGPMLDMMDLMYR